MVGVPIGHECFIANDTLLAVASTWRFCASFKFEVCVLEDSCQCDQSISLVLGSTDVFPYNFAASFVEGVWRRAHLVHDPRQRAVGEKTSRTPSLSVLPLYHTQRRSTLKPDWRNIKSIEILTRR